MRWLTPSALDRWRQARIPNLEPEVQVDRSKISLAFDALRSWAQECGLEPSEGEYLARSRWRTELAFTTDGDADLERQFRTRWKRPGRAERQAKAVEDKATKPPDLVVISPLNEFTCEACGGKGDLLIMEGPGPLCMVCADMDHPLFLATGDAALTRRARKASGLSAVVVRFSRARKRYERQGILVEESALEEAEAQCLADEEIRVRRRERDRIRRQEEDQDFQKRFAAAIARLFPGCPENRAEAVAAHAAVRGSGRVGRSAAARELDPRTIELAVMASIRHEDTDYDQLLMSGVAREAARQQVGPTVRRRMQEWRNP